MTVRTRDKGVKGEREVAAIFQTAGFDVRGLESAGDWLAVALNGRVLHVETKRQERLRVPEWIAQAETDCPQGVAWVLAFRQSRRPWYGVQPLAVIAEREARIAELEDMLTVAIDKMTRRS